MFREVKPRAPRGTRNPRMPSCVDAHTTAISAIDPLVIHILEPDRTQSPPLITAFVFMLDGSLPWSGSVRPKQPIASPAASVCGGARLSAPRPGIGHDGEYE